MACASTCETLQPSGVIPKVATGRIVQCGSGATRELGGPAVGLDPA